MFTTRTSDVFALPKLIALWLFLIAALVLAGVGVLRGGTRAMTFGRLHVVDGAVVAFLVLNLVAFGFSTDLHQSLFGERAQYQGMLTICLYVAYFALARLALSTRPKVEALFAAAVTGGALVAGYGIVQDVGIDPVWHGELAPGRRVFSAIGQPNALAAYLVIPLALAVPLLANPRRAVRVAALAAIAVMVTCVLLTASRGGYGGALVALAVAAGGMCWRSRLEPRRVLAGAAAITVGLLASYAVVGPVRSTVDDAWDRALSSTHAADDVSIRYHLDFWHEATRIALDHPLTGTGQETFPDVLPHYLGDLGYLRGIAVSQYRVESPHNVYLATAAGAGFPTLGAYVAVIGCAVALMLRAAGATRARGTRIALVAIVGAVLGHLVTDSFMTAEVTSSWMLWIILGAGVGLAARELGRDQRTGPCADTPGRSAHYDPQPDGGAIAVPLAGVVQRQNISFPS